MHAYINARSRTRAHTHTHNTRSPACRWPVAGELVDYVSFLSRLPLSETPEMFGLHPNALITRNLQDTKLMLDSLLATMSQVRGCAHAHICMCIHHEPGASVRMRTCLCICPCVCVRVCTWFCACIPGLRLCVCVRVCVRLYVCVRALMEMICRCALVRMSHGGLGQRSLIVWPQGSLIVWSHWCWPKQPSCLPPSNSSSSHIVYVSMHSCTHTPPTHTHAHVCPHARSHAHICCRAEREQRVRGRQVAGGHRVRQRGRDPGQVAAGL